MVQDTAAGPTLVTVPAKSIPGRLRALARFVAAPSVRKWNGNEFQVASCGVPSRTQLDTPMVTL